MTDSIREFCTSSVTPYHISLNSLSDASVRRQASLQSPIMQFRELSRRELLRELYKSLLLLGRVRKFGRGKKKTSLQVKTNYNTLLLWYYLWYPSTAMEAQCGDQAKQQGVGIQLVLRLYTPLCVIRFYTVYLIPALHVPTNSQSPLLLWQQPSSCNIPTEPRSAMWRVVGWV